MPLPSDFVPYSAVLKRLKTAMKTAPLTVAAAGGPGAAVDRTESLAKLREAHEAQKTRNPERELVEALRRRMDEVHLLPDAREELQLAMAEFVDEEKFQDGFRDEESLMRASTAASLTRPQTVGFTKRSSDVGVPISVLAGAVNTPMLSETLRLLRGLLRGISDSAVTAQIAALLGIAVFAVHKETASISRRVPGKPANSDSTLNRSSSSLLTPACVRKSVVLILGLPPRGVDAGVGDKLQTHLLSKANRVEDPLEMSLQFLMEFLGVSRRHASETLAGVLLDEGNERVRRVLGVCAQNEYLPLAVLRRDPLNAEELVKTELAKLGVLSATVAGLQKSSHIAKSKAHAVLALADDFNVLEHHAVNLALMTIDE